MKGRLKRLGLITCLTLGSVEPFQVYTQDVKNSSVRLLNFLKPYIQQQSNLTTDFNIIVDALPAELSTENEQTLILKSIQILPNAQRFIAQVNIKDAPPSIPPFLITGQIQILMSVPVLSRPIGLNEEIQKEDLIWQKVPLSRINSNHLTRLEDLVGRMSNSQILQPNQPLNRFDVKYPVLIKRGSRIQVTYKTVNLTLTRSAEAQQEGARGETIRLIIPDTKKIIHAVVLSSQEAELIL